ncbi:MAG TPA: asparaginase [Gaiellaceae bacterium]|nr:asparaginase [Gaiellaceae bacterium]
MSEPIVVEVRRGRAVEAVHRVHAVAVRSGEVVAAAGDASFTCFMRSSSKPLQALPLVRARDDVPDDELAVACASHRGAPEQVAAVRALLARAGATEGDLELGVQEVRPPGRIYNNCSGNHAGMLALCRARGWPTEGYRLPEHPVQLACREVHAEVAEVATESLETGTDGCGIVTFALTLERMAHAFSRLESVPGGPRVAAAMRARPDLVGGPDGVDYLLMRDAPGWLAKGGAEGLLCAAGPGGIGVAVKTEDGASRPHAPALAAFLGRLGVDLPGLAAQPVVNTRGEPVGKIGVALSALRS